MRVIENRRARFGFLLIVLSVLLAGDAWRFTFGWWFFGGLAVTVGVICTWLLVVQRRRWRFDHLPYPLVVLLALATASIAWSFYPGATALGLLTTWLTTIVALAIAVTYSWPEIVASLGMLLRLLLGASLLFELFVSLVLRRPLLPFHTQPGVDYSDYERIPRMLYWSRDELFGAFDGGRIQGIVGNANHLGMIALLGVVVFAIQLADRSTRRSWTILWLAVAGLTLLLTSSATVTVALAVAIIVVVAVIAVRRAPTERARLVAYAVIAAVAAAGIALGLVLRDSVLGLLGRSADFTGRIGIWEKVIELAQQRPAFGWGWVSYWMPWAPPFDDLVYRNGVRQLQAHNVWLDLWLQVGIVGLVLFAALVVSALARSWSFAVDRPTVAPADHRAYHAWSLLPVVILVILLVQSVAESRLITEYGWALLVIIAMKTKAQDDSALAVGRA